MVEPPSPTRRDASGSGAGRFVCAVHWAGPEDLRAGDEALLSAAELERVRALRRPDDRARFVVAAALLRRAAAAETGEAPERVAVDRRCPTCGRQHGRPTLPGTGLHASITHAGGVVGVALTRAGPVGLDVEDLAREVMSLTRHVLGPGEQAGDSAAFYRYWTRKEALVKATGDGIGVGLPNVLVSGPEEPPRLLAYGGRPGLVAQMADLSPAPGHVASVAVLAAEPVQVRECRGRPAAGGAQA